MTKLVTQDVSYKAFRIYLATENIMSIHNKDKVFRTTSVNSALEVLISVVHYDHMSPSIGALIDPRKNDRFKLPETQNDL